MGKVLFVGFKGKNNASGRMAESISPDHLLLTNSFTGLKKDIDSITEEYDLAVMFGVDKTLSSTRYADEVFIDKMIVSVRKSNTECICRQIKETSC